MKLLVVDDDFVILNYLEKLLGKRGHQVLALRCDSHAAAAEVLEHVRFIKFDAALVGLMMPGMNGLSAATWINKLSPLTKVIITIEPVPLDEADWLHRQGIVFGQLPAPFEPEELFCQLGPL
jgi:CheY-like chemotaxis protein